MKERLKYTGVGLAGLTVLGLGVYAYFRSGSEADTQWQVSTSTIGLLPTPTQTIGPFPGSVFAETATPTPTLPINLSAFPQETVRTLGFKDELSRFLEALTKIEEAEIIVMQKDGSWCNGVRLERGVATITECLSPYWQDWQDMRVGKKGSWSKINSIHFTSNKEVAFLARRTGIFTSEVKSEQISKSSPGDVLLAAGFMPVFVEQQINYEQMAVPFTVIEANDKETFAAIGVEKPGDFAIFNQMRGMGLYRIADGEVELIGLLTDVDAKGENPVEISNYLLQRGFLPSSFDFLARFVSVE